MKKEIEVKIKLTRKEFKEFSKKASVSNLEITYGYFKDGFSNIEEGIFPRIKYILGVENIIILTVKTKKMDNPQYFEREEMEVRICEEENIDSVRELVKSLGFSKEIIFEKKRKNISEDDITISFDELPFGFFVEFEGSQIKIKQYLDEYNLSKRPRVVRAYLGLWEDYRKAHGIIEENCVFRQ